MIDVSDFHKVFSGHIAVNGVSFQVARGQTLGLIGPNGAGKTTTMRALAGVLPATRGKLIVAGHDIQQEPIAAKKSLAYVPDDPPLFHDLTVSEHLAFYASVYGVENANEVASQLLGEFELSQKHRTVASDLSRGMRQKLAICCALLHDPQVVLLDEPLTGLDPRGIRQLKESLAERVEQGVTFVISSHLLAMVEDICTHVMILDKGARKFLGRIELLRETFNGQAGSTSLEDIYFEATGSEQMVSVT